MQDLNKALADITAIRTQIARGAEFRGYGPLTMTLTGVLAIVAALLQALWLPEPTADIPAYLALWVATATISVVLIVTEMVARTRRIHSSLADEMILAATEQFLPAAAAGALLTVVLYRFAPESLWMLPGLWQIVFSLGLFASCRSLPRVMFVAAVWYLVAGLGALALANGPQALSPYAMGVPYGIGQILIALLLYQATGAADAEG